MIPKLTDYIIQFVSKLIPCLHLEPILTQHMSALWDSTWNIYKMSNLIFSSHGVIINKFNNILGEL